MIQQINEMLFINLILGIATILFLFVLAIFMVKWKASTQGLDTSLNKAIVLCFVWLIIDLVFWGLLYATVLILSTDLVLYVIISWILIIIRLITKLIVGGISASKIYKLTFKEGINFVLLIVIVLFLIWLAINFGIRPLLGYIYS